jgi:serine/threonine-protein kinase
MQVGNSGHTVRFAAFELDLKAGELRRFGVLLPVQGRPLQVLAVLLRTPGQLVSTEQLRAELWPSDTFVDFEHGVRNAVARLRAVLNDSADKPRFVETLPRRGYRFIGAVAESAPQPIPSTPTGPGRGYRFIGRLAQIDRQTAAETRGAAPSIGTSNRPSEANSTPEYRRARIVISSLLAAIILIASVSAWHYRHARSAFIVPTQPLLRLDIELGKNVGRFGGADVILSPDGTRLVYVSQSKLSTRRLDQANATELPGTEGALAPFFSPDGHWVAFFTPGELKKVSVLGGPAIELCKITGYGGSWGEDGNIIATPALGPLLRVPSSGGVPTKVTELMPGEVAHRWPQVLPGGKGLLFSTYISPLRADGASTVVMSLADRRRKTVQRGGTYGRYLPSGHLVYISNGTLFAVPFDLERMQSTGTSVPVLQDVAYNGAYGSAQIDFSRTGALVYQSRRTGVDLKSLQWLDAAGKAQPLPVGPAEYLFPRLSPDGNRLALTSAWDIWVYEWRRDTMMRLTFGGGHSYPVWSSDGRYVVFAGSGGMFWIRADGVGKPQPLTQSQNPQYPWSLTADGRRMAFVEASPETGANLWTLPLKIDDEGVRAGRPEVFLRTSFDEEHPSFSPDGHWLAYTSTESGTYQVYVRAFPDKGGEWQISNGGGSQPVWAHHGRELFFTTLDNEIMVARYTVQGDSFTAERPRPWSEKRLANVGYERNYDLGSDDRRIVGLMPAEITEEPQSHVIFLINFFDELRRRMSMEHQ